MPWSKRHAPGKISRFLSLTSVRILQLYLVYVLGFIARLLLNISFYRGVGKLIIMVIFYELFIFSNDIPH